MQQIQTASDKQTYISPESPTRITKPKCTSNIYTYIYIYRMCIVTATFIISVEINKQFETEPKARATPRLSIIFWRRDWPVLIVLVTDSIGEKQRRHWARAREYQLFKNMGFLATNWHWRLFGFSYSFFRFNMQTITLNYQNCIYWHNYCCQSKI